MALHNPVSPSVLEIFRPAAGRCSCSMGSLAYSACCRCHSPQLEQGLQIGDVRADRAVIWSRSDRPARLLVEYDVSEHFVKPTRVRGPFALDTTDFAALT